MKKIIVAIVFVMLMLSLVPAGKILAQDAPSQAAPKKEGQNFEIKDPAEFDAYQKATSQTDGATRAAALESFLKSYPQSAVKQPVLVLLMNTYQSLGDNDKTLDAAGRLLQADPNNLQAIVYTVLTKKAECGKTADPPTCDSAAAMAKQGLALTKPDGVADADWQRQTHVAFPLFHSAIAWSDVIQKQNNKEAIAEFTAELHLYSDDETKSGDALSDTLQLAENYLKPDGRDVPLAVWFFCRAWNYAPAQYRGSIEAKIEYWYRAAHGSSAGIADVKREAQAATFPPPGYSIGKR